MGNIVHVFDTAWVDLTRDKMVFFYGFDEPIDAVISCYLIDTGEHRILVDTGIGDPDADHLKHYGFKQSNEQVLTARLHDLGYNPDDIDMVVNTHLHIDHCGNNKQFRRARIFVNAEEVRFAFLPGYQDIFFNRRDFDHELNYVYVHGEYSPAPGVRIIPTPGHTPGHQSVLVETDTEKILITGDACRLHEHWEGKGDTIMHNSVQYAHSQEHMHSLGADVVLISHDGEAFRQYKQTYGN